MSIIFIEAISRTFLKISHTIIRKILKVRGNNMKEPFEITPISFYGRKKGPKQAEYFQGKGKKYEFVSKAEAEKDPEKMKQYQKQVEGYKKSAEVRRQKRMERQKMRETLEEMLASDYDLLHEWIEFKFDNYDHLKPTPDRTKDWFKDRGRNLTVQDAVVLSVLKNAVQRGDMKSIEFIRDTIGEKPKVEVETNANIQNVQGFSELANSLFGETKTENKNENKDN